MCIHILLGKKASYCPLLTLDDFNLIVYIKVY